MKPSVLVKSVMTIAMTAGFAASASAGCGNGSLYCGGSSNIQPLSAYNTGTTQYVPFSSPATTTSNISLAGLGANESLSPTSCPVDVNGLQPGQSVLGCYQVMKQNQSTVRYHYGAPNTVRYVRPVIYVRYPVPTPVYHVPVPVPTPVPGRFFGPQPGFGFGPAFGPGFGPGPVGCAPPRPAPITGCGRW